MIRNSTWHDRSRFTLEGTLSGSALQAGEFFDIEEGNLAVCDVDQPFGPQATHRPDDCFGRSAH